MLAAAAGWRPSVTGRCGLLQPPHSGHRSHLDTAAPDFQRSRGLNWSANWIDFFVGFIKLDPKLRSHVSCNGVTKVWFILSCGGEMERWEISTMINVKSFHVYLHFTYTNSGGLTLRTAWKHFILRYILEREIQCFVSCAVTLLASALIVLNLTRIRMGSCWYRSD